MSTLRSVPVLVTGGTGFIGSHLVRRLLLEQAEVHVLSRPAPDTGRSGTGVTRWTASLEDAAVIRRCLEEARPLLVFHLAGDSEVRRGGGDAGAVQRSVEANLAGTLNIAAAAAATGVQRLLRAGGLEEYGNGPAPFSEEQRESPISPYSASQVAAAHYWQMLQRHVDVSLVTLRLALVYGPGQSPGFLVPSLIRSCLSGEDFEMTAGEQTRDVLFVEDAVGAFVAAATCPHDLRGEIVNIGSGIERRVRDIAETIVRLTGSSAGLRLGSAPERLVEMERLVCRTEKALRLLGWSAETDLDEGLRRTIDAARTENLP